MAWTLRIVAALLLLMAGGGVGAHAQDARKGTEPQPPPGCRRLTAADLSIRAPARTFLIVALECPGAVAQGSDAAPPRPLLIYEHKADGRFVLAGRNDHVVLRSDEGGQCDPFGDDGRIAVKGPYFTVENAVACGNHWTDYVTFRFDPRLGGFVLDNWRSQSWSLNTSQDPNAEALVSDGQKVVRAPKDHPVRFSEWKRPS